LLHQLVHILLYCIDFTPSFVNAVQPTISNETVYSESPKGIDSLLKVFDPFVSTDSTVCVVPFSRAGNLIIIRAKIDTIVGNFIFDSGAPSLILNSTYFRNYANTSTEVEDAGGITGGANSIGHTLVNSLQFSGVNFSKIDADRISLGHIENSKGIKILGLLGIQLFKQFEVIIDYASSTILLHLVAKKEKIPYQNELLKDTSTYFKSPIQLVDNKLIATVYIAEKKLKFIIDTGAETNVIDSRLPNKIFENIIIGRRVFLSGTGSKKIDALTGNVNTITIGKQDIFNLPVIVTNLEKMCTSYDRCLDGMLGFDYLSQQKIGFNFVKQEMYVWK
jgi:hypothetical protein